MNWWDSSGAFALYGVVAGAVLTGVFSLLSNQHSAKLAQLDRGERAAEAQRTRDYETDPENRRETQAMRREVYPEIAASIMSASSSIGQYADDVITGEKSNPDMSQTAQQYVSAFGALAVFYSDRTKTEWETFIKHGGEVFAAVKKVAESSDSDRAENLAALKPGQMMSGWRSWQSLSQCSAT
jgi:hypothetical protein